MTTENTTRLQHNIIPISQQEKQLGEKNQQVTFIGRIFSYIVSGFSYLVEKVKALFAYIFGDTTSSEEKRLPHHDRIQAGEQSIQKEQKKASTIRLPQQLPHSSHGDTQSTFTEKKLSHPNPAQAREESIQKKKVPGTRLAQPSPLNLHTTQSTSPILESCIKPSRRAGIKNFHASSCYFASTLQAFAGSSARDMLTEGSSPTAQFYKKVFQSLDKEKSIPVETTAEWIREAHTLKLTDKAPGNHGDPVSVIENTLGSISQGKASGLYIQKKNKLKPVSVLRSIPVPKVSEGTSLQEIIDGRTPALSATRVQDTKTAPPLVSFSLQGRTSTTKGYDAKRVTIPHEISIKTKDDAAVKYALTSAIIFEGEKSSGAENHYYTYEYATKAENTTTWTEYNDSCVRERVDQDKKIQDLIERRGYVLFYSKVKSA